MSNIPPLNPFSMNKCLFESVNNSKVTHNILMQDNPGAEN